MSPVTSHFDTIVAPITAPGRAAVAAVRVSGADAFGIARSVFRGLADPPESRRAVYGRFEHGDDGLALPFEAGTGYTGEACVEFFIHGSPTSVRQLVDLCIGAGARLAEPGEFTLRAFANGRLDLAQAEAVVELVESDTDAQLKAAAAQLAGALTASVQVALNAIESVIVSFEANLDFSEEIGPLDFPTAAQELAAAKETVEDLLGWERPAALVRDGLKVAIVGRPNAGKSSLFNALVGSERAIVTNIPGTTRDVLEVTIDVRGVPVTLYDTAGIRHEADEVEAIGIDRARQAAGSAHKTIFVFDGSAGLTDQDRELLGELEDPIIVATKSDLPHEPTSYHHTSVVTLDGLPALLDHLVAASENLNLPFLLNRRHGDCLREADTELAAAIDGIAAEVSPDLVLPALYASAAAMRQILGQGVAPDVIDQIFSRFCIGK